MKLAEGRSVDSTGGIGSCHCFGRWGRGRQGSASAQTVVGCWSAAVRGNRVEVALTVVDTPTLVHRLNRLSPLPGEINDETFPSVPPPRLRFVAAVHLVGESDTDSVEFHAIHTPAGSDGSESEDVVPIRAPMI